MNQSERREYLIKILLSENPQYADVHIPEAEAEQKRLLRALMNVRMPAPVRQDFLDVQDAYLQEELRYKGVTDLADLSPMQDGIYLWQGDIQFRRGLCAERDSREVHLH